MCNSIIPKRGQTKHKSLIPKQEVNLKKGISFSFEILERTEYFNIDSTCANWSSDLFEMMRNVSKMDKCQLLLSGNGTYRVHSHENANPPNPFPENVNANDCYQIRISKSKGGIHGVFYENVFYVLWLDPLHNMYPDERYGGLKRIKPPKNCCMERDEELDEMRKEIGELKKKIKISKSYLMKYKNVVE